jgi:hypothetical protein
MSNCNGKSNAESKNGLRVRLRPLKSRLNYIKYYELEAGAPVLRCAVLDDIIPRVKIALWVK